MPSDAPLGHDDLIFYASTIFARSLEDKLIAAASGGFAGIALWSSDRKAAHHAGLTDGDIRALLARHHLRVAGIDCLFGWAGGETLPANDAFTLSAKDMIEAADALGAPAINLAHAFGPQINEPAAIERLGTICAQAAACGLLVTLEAIPWAGIATHIVARRLIEASGAANARLAIDAWHFFRGGGDVAEIASIPPALIGNVQFADAALEVGTDPWADTSNRNLPLGGALPIADLAVALRAAGYAGPFGIECPSPVWEGLDAATIGRHCGDAMRRLGKIAP